MTTKTKTFDCIAMKRKAQEAIRAQVRGMTREEEAAFFCEGREEFEKRIQAAKRQRCKRASSE
ncbi:MAG: hypothetical protein GX594_05250 [Pirellulaceae bacterium]|nr:hypothetical protein [Pirellulaceae bacterium]